MIAHFTTALLGFSAVLAAVIVIRLLRGDIHLRDMLTSRAGRGMEPERVQAVIVALLLPAAYAAQVFAEARGDELALKLPDASEWMLALAAGSQTLYLGGKIARR